MLDNTITLQVDVLHDAVLVPHPFTRFEQFLNRTVYVGPGSSDAYRNQMTLLRSTPTESGNFRGVKKTSLKFTKDVGVIGVDATTLNVAPIIGAVNFSIPVGASAAEVLIVREHLIAALNDQDLSVRLLEKREI